MTDCSMGIMGDILLGLRDSIIREPTSTSNSKITAATMENTRKMTIYLKIENMIPLSKFGVAVVSIHTAPAAVVTPAAEVEKVGVAVMYLTTVSVTVVVTACATTSRS